MYLVDGVIMVTDIMKGSPAEAAGFKVEDIVIGVENNFTGNIQAYKTLLQNAGARVKVVMNRKGELILINMKVKNIL